MPLPPFGQVAEFNRENAENVLRVAMHAAGGAAMRPGPPSSVRNPDGSQQGETMAERDNRIVRTAFMHLLEQNLIVLPADIEQTLDGWIPLDRVGKD